MKDTQLEASIRKVIREELERIIQRESQEEGYLTGITDKTEDNHANTQSDSEKAKFSNQFSHFQSDAPVCPNCGCITVRNGNCYLCHNCGSSLGCS